MRPIAVVPWCLLIGCATAPTGPKFNKDGIRDTIRPRLGEVKACYDKARVAEPKLTGELLVEFEVDKAGRVTSTTVKNSSLASPELEACTIERLKTWTFPPPEKETGVVTYPFIFKTKTTQPKMD